MPRICHTPVIPSNSWLQACFLTLPRASHAPISTTSKIVANRLQSTYSLFELSRNSISNVPDLLQGNIATNQRVRVFDPIHDSVREALAARLPEYSTTQNITLFVGTWNLNGRVSK